MICLTGDLHRLLSDFDGRRVNRVYGGDIVRCRSITTPEEDVIVSRRSADPSPLENLHLFSIHTVNQDLR